MPDKACSEINLQTDTKLTELVNIYRTRRVCSNRAQEKRGELWETGSKKLCQVLQRGTPVGIVHQY